MHGRLWLRAVSAPAPAKGSGQDAALLVCPPAKSLGVDGRCFAPPPQAKGSRTRHVRLPANSSGVGDAHHRFLVASLVFKQVWNRRQKHEAEVKNQIFSSSWLVNNFTKGLHIYHLSSHLNYQASIGVYSKLGRVFNFNSVDFCTLT